MVPSARTTTLLGVLLSTAGCMQDTPSPPASLADGSAARPPPVELEGSDRPSLVTRVRVVQPGAAEPGSATASCVGSGGVRAGPAIERVDTLGTTVTHLAPGRVAAFACDASVRGPGSDRSWCGSAFGRLREGRLRDPRLSLTCRDAARQPVGFAWIQPGTASEYVAVARPGYSDVYPVAGGIPIRVATRDVDVDASGATFDVREYSRTGRLLREYELEARVSG